MRDVLATKSDPEREDAEVERLVREAPKRKPPRHDRRRERMDTERDADTDGDPDLHGEDTSLNFKSIGGSLDRLVRRYAVRASVSGAAKEPGKVLKPPRPRGPRKKRIPALSKETGETVMISPETLKTEPGKYEKIDAEKEDSGSVAGGAAPAGETGGSTKKPRKPRKQKAKPEPAERQVVKRTDEPSDDDHEYQEVDLEPDEKPSPDKDTKTTDDGDAGESTPKPKGKGKGKGKGKAKAKPAPEPEPSVGEKLGIKPPTQREASAEERAEVAVLLADSLPPAVAANLIAKGVHPDDAKALISNYKAASARPVGNPAEFAARAAQIYQTDPDKVDPPKTWRTAEGKKVAFEELPPEEQSTAYRQHQMQVVAMSLAARSQLEKKLSFDGAIPPKVVQALVGSLLPAPKPKENDAEKPDQPDRPKGKKGAETLDTPEGLFAFVTEAEGFTKIPDGAAKQMLAAVKGNEATQGLVRAFLEGNDYKRAKDLYLGQGVFSERDDPKSIADGLRSARDFFKVRAGVYGGDGHDGSKRFETRVLSKLRELEPDKYNHVRRALDQEDAKAYQRDLKKHKKIMEAWFRRSNKGIASGDPPRPPIEPAGYSNTKTPEQLQAEGSALWTDLHERSGKKKTAAAVTYRYLISSYLNRLSMDRTSAQSSRRALYHGVAPAVNYPREAYPGSTQAPARDLAEGDVDTILAAARTWLESPVLTQGMTGLDATQKLRFAMDLALSAGTYKLDATTYNRILARLSGAPDSGSVVVDDPSGAKTASTPYHEAIFRQFPADQRSKAGGRLNVMLTGTTARALKRAAFTTVALDELPQADLDKLSLSLRRTAAREHSGSSFASAGEPHSSTTSNGRPITETVIMLRLSSDQKNQANQILSTLDKTAQAIQENFKAWGIPFKVAKDLVNRLDKTADAAEALIYGDVSLRTRQAEVAVGSEDFAKAATAEGLLSKEEFAKAAKVIQRDSDEGYMSTFDNPHAPVDTNADEPYMSSYADDQSSAVSSGKDSAGRALAP